MERFSLYLRYALRSFIRGRSRSLFGAFAVGIGIASVVALGLVGGNFRDAVTGNAQKLNRGDVSVTYQDRGFSIKQYAYVASLKSQGKITDYTSVLRSNTLMKNPGGDRGNDVIGDFVAVEPKKFPFYDTIRGDNPSNVPLSTLLNRPDAAVVSHTVFDTLHLRIGGTIKLSYRFGGTGTFRVAGIVPDNAPDSGFGGGLFPYFVMVDRAAMQTYIRDQGVGATAVYAKTSNLAQAQQVKGDLQRHLGPFVNAKTVTDVEKDSKNSAEGMDKFLRMMSLLAVIIGGIGIINTMLVTVRRRAKEIAVLKALGMKGRQVVLVFTIEALILAIAGTIFGVLVGILASKVVTDVTQSLAGYPIPWSLHPNAIIAGILVGIVATVLFAYMPVLRASRARPVAALRSDIEAQARYGRFRAFAGTMRRQPLRTIGGGLRRTPRGILRLPRRQGLRSALLILLLAAVMGYLGVLYTGLYGGSDTVKYGILAGIATLLIAGILTQIFVVIVWLVSKLPTFHRLTLRMAFRTMGTQKRRLASTLLALSVGILAIGAIVLLANNIKTELGQSLKKHEGFNIHVQAPHDPALLARITTFARTLPGVQQVSSGAIANNASLSAVDGKPVSRLLPELLSARDQNGKLKHNKDEVSQALSASRAVAGRDLRSGKDNYVVASGKNGLLGRNLNASDVGTNHLVVSEDFTTLFNIKLGSHLVYTDGTTKVPFTVVGILSQNNFLTTAETLTDLQYMKARGLTSPSGSHNALTLLSIDDAHSTKDVATIRKTFPKALVLDLSSFLQFLKIIDKLALFPEIIAALALFAGGIIIANTVALAMLERRREIGIMKAVGARRRTILGFLLVENAIVGFLGAGVGVIFAMIASSVFSNSVGITPSFDPLTIIALIAVGVVLAIVASSLTALPASTEKPMSVLRYE